MAHRAGTGDAPIPGLITSRRNPAYKLKPRPKEVPFVPQIPAGWVRRAERAEKERKRKDRSRDRDRSPPRRAPSPPRETSEERRSKERRQEEEEKRREEEAAEADARKKAEEEENKRRWAEQEARWAEERRLREEQRKLEADRQNQRKNKLKGAFAMDDDGEEEEAERARDLAERQKRKTRDSAAAAPSLITITPVTSSALSLPESKRVTIDPNTDAISLRASLADPAAARTHNPGEVAEHFRRLSEMKRKFRRAEFGGPDRSALQRERERSPRRSRSRSREKYNSVWIRPDGSKSDGTSKSSRR